MQPLPTGRNATAPGLYPEIGFTLMWVRMEPRRTWRRIVKGQHGEGTPANPWELWTPDRIHRYRVRVDSKTKPPALICTVGVDSFGYQLRCVEDLYKMLVGRGGDWVDLGVKDEKGLPGEGTVEAWARSPDNPVGGWYGLKPGWRGRFAMYVPPLLERFGLAELEHRLTNNRMRAIPDRRPPPPRRTLQ